MQFEEPRIWVVDDNRFDREWLRDALGGLGQIETFDDGESALWAARAAAPDLIVTDCVMPGMSGPELLEGLRAERPEVDVILVATGEERFGAFSARSFSIILGSVFGRIRHKIYKGILI